METQWKIGTRARQAGLTRKTIRFDEDAGVLPAREDIRRTQVQNGPKQRPARPLDSAGARTR